MLSKSWKRRIRKRLAKLFAEQPAAHWVELLDGKVPFSPQLTADEWLHAPEPLAGGLTVDVDDPRHGKMRQLGVQVSLAGTADRWFDPRTAADGDLEAVLRALEQTPSDDAAEVREPPAEAQAASGAPAAEAGDAERRHLGAAGTVDAGRAAAEAGAPPVQAAPTEGRRACGARDGCSEPRRRGRRPASPRAACPGNARDARRRWRRTARSPAAPLGAAHPERRPRA